MRASLRTRSKRLRPRRHQRTRLYLLLARCYAQPRMSASLRRLATIMASKAVVGQVVLTGSGNWTVPPGVFSISVVAVGPGGPSSLVAKVGVYGGGGGELRYKNNIAVTPGASIPYSVGSSTLGVDSPPTTFNTSVVVANGGTKTGGGGAGGTGDGGGNGGTAPLNFGGSGGGGAGGYSGSGGVGGNGAGAPGAGSGGGGGGGSGTDGSKDGGGGVDLLGQGSDGSAGGGGGSGGASSTGHAGGQYGGGGGRQAANTVGGIGGLRIIWPGNTRQFPSTNTGDL